MNEMETAIKIEGLKKRYRLGVIGGGTLRGDIQSWWARIHGKEDPNTLIGSAQFSVSDTFYALNGIDLEVKKGERLGIIGHNGAGKSTLLKLLSRVTAPTEGRILIDGRISSMLEVGTGFNPELTGRENIYLNGAILGMSRTEVESKINEIIEFSECVAFIDTPVKRYSSGMYVKLAFAVAAHLDSEILVMDEVLAVGDMAFQKKCLSKMSEVSRGEGRTILYVSHNMNTIRQLCDRCIVMDHGRIIYQGDVEESISIYLNNETENEAFYDLNSTKRPYAHYGQKVRIKAFEFADKKIKFNSSDEMQFKITVQFDSDYPEMGIRAEVSYYDETRIGIFEAHHLLNCTHGTKEFVFTCVPHMLPIGKYYMYLDIYETNSFSRHVSLDHPLKKIAFEIVADDNDRIFWDHKYMGHVRLGDLVQK